MRQPSSSRAADPSMIAAVSQACRRMAPEAHVATAFLPTSKRLAARAVIAFFAMIRDAISTPGQWQGGCASSAGGAILEQGYSLLLERIDELYESDPNHRPGYDRGEAQQILQAVAHAVARYQVSKAHFRGFAQGCRDDATVMRYATWSALRAHCQRMGGSVARALGSVLGFTNSAVAEDFEQLGTAARLIGLLRDLRSDVARNQLYLPLEDLARFQVSQSELTAWHLSDRLGGLLRFEVARAWNLLGIGCEAIGWMAGDGSRMAASIVAVRYAALLRAVERPGNYDALPARRRQRRRMAALDLRLLATAWRLARRKPGRPLPDLLGSRRPGG
jgi:phytoene/squalene synthetase